MALHTEIYESSPVWLQNALCTLYGMRQRRTYYGGSFARQLDDFRANEYRPLAELQEMQINRLRRILTDAVSHVNYYGKLINRHDAERITWDDFRSLPILEKEAVRAASSDFVSNKIPKRRRFVAYTSGTTGTPLVTYSTAYALSQLWTAMERLRARAGVSKQERRASLTGKVFVPTSRDAKGTYWRYDLAGRRLLLSVYHLNDRTVDRYAAILRWFKPAFIDGYPSAMQRIAAFMEAHPAERAPSVRAAFPTAETLTPETRQSIERGLGVKVFNQYGSTEIAAHAAECEYGNMHLSPEIGIVELLDRAGKPVRPGEVGHMVLTTLVNDAMPLIRYRIGDMAVACDADEHCPCGRTLPIMGHVVGRSDNQVQTPDGRLLPIMSYHVMKVASGVKEALLIQEELQRFTLMVVPDDSKSLDLRQSIRELEKRMACPIVLDVVRVDQIPKTARGKLQGVVSKVGA